MKNNKYYYTYTSSPSTFIFFCLLDVQYCLISAIMSYSRFSNTPILCPILLALVFYSDILNKILLKEDFFFFVTFFRLFFRNWIIFYNFCYTETFLNTCSYCVSSVPFYTFSNLTFLSWSLTFIGL